MIYKAKNKPEQIDDNNTHLILAATLFTFLFLIASLLIWYFAFDAKNYFSADEPQTGKTIYNGAYIPLKKSASPYSQITIVIDPGHGGSDPGALKNGYNEADINFEVAQLLINKLNNSTDNILVVTTRNGDENISTSQRAKIAMDNNANLLISLHLNSDKYSSSRGFQLFVPPPGWVYHSESTALATLIRDNLSNSIHALPFLGTQGIYYTFYEPTSNGGYNKEIYDAHWYPYSPQRKSETFGVLERSGCPSILIEQWFISNETDMELMYTPEGMELMANAIYISILEYFEIN